MYKLVIANTESPDPSVSTVASNVVQESALDEILSGVAMLVLGCAALFASGFAAYAAITRTLGYVTPPPQWSMYLIAMVYSAIWVSVVMEFPKMSQARERYIHSRIEVALQGRVLRRVLSASASRHLIGAIMIAGIGVSLSLRWNGTPLANSSTRWVGDLLFAVVFGMFFSSCRRAFQDAEILARHDSLASTDDANV